MLLKFIPLISAGLLLSACSVGGYSANLKDGGYTGVPSVAPSVDADPWMSEPSPVDGVSGETEIIENPFINPTTTNTSNVSLTSSTFSYPVVREMINQGTTWNLKGSVVIEEMLNYFSYGYVNYTDKELVSFLELEKCPWNEEHYLASVVVKATPAETENVKNNIVILVDTSGSMTGIFDLVKESLYTLINGLGNDDMVSIVSYASRTQIEIEAKTGKDKKELTKTVDGLMAGGSTWGEGGIELAYAVAREHFIEGGNNRVVILTDGDFNVGKVSGDELTTLIKEKAQQGIYLTCCGYRSGYANHTMKILADNGNGNAYYIDDSFEAKKVFEEEFGKAMFAVAKDAKCQVEFNPETVNSYRLLGYETRQMSDDEFNDYQKDAGEIMSDHTSIALYELDLKDNVSHDEWDYIFKSTLRYKKIANGEPVEVANTKNSIGVFGISDFNFASYVCEFGLTLIESQYKGASSLEHLIARVNNNYISDKYRDDFMATVHKTKQLFEKINK